MLDDSQNNPYASPISTSRGGKREAQKRGATPKWIAWIAVVFGLVVGAVCSYVRPMISGPIHYEAIASLFLIVLFLVITVCIRLETDRPLQWTGIVVVLTWLSHFTGWSLVSQRMWDDLAGVTAVGIGCSLAVALPIVFWLHRMRNGEAQPR